MAMPDNNLCQHRPSSGTDDPEKAMKVTRVTRDFAHFSKIGRLHATELSAGLLPLFGVPFLTSMYRLASDYPGTTLIVAVDGQNVAGFVMGSEAPSRFYLGLLLRTWPRLAGTLLLKPRAIIRAFSLARHVIKPQNNAELLSIVVHPSYRNRGVAEALLHEFKNSLAASGVKSFCVIAADTQPAALRFYQKTGGVIVAESNLGGLRALTFLYDVA